MMFQQIPLDRSTIVAGSNLSSCPSLAIAASAPTGQSLTPQKILRSVAASCADGPCLCACGNSRLQHPGWQREVLLVEALSSGSDPLPAEPTPPADDATEQVVDWSIRGDLLLPLEIPGHCLPEPRGLARRE